MPDEYSPEDKERLVDLRFGELYDRHSDAKLDARIDKRLMEWADLAMANGQVQQPSRATSSRPLPPTEPQPKPRRRSAFDIALAQALGMS